MEPSSQIYVSANGSTIDSTFVKAVRSEVESNENTEGSFLYEWNDKTYAVTYGYFARIMDNWLYVSASPITNITAPVVFISKVILTVSLSALLLAMLAWLASIRMYLPVKRLMKDLRERLLGGRRPGGRVYANRAAMAHLSSESRELNAKRSAYRT